MPPHEDTRSPAGSSSSKRGHRDDDYYERSRKDGGRSHRHRSRTRSPDRRYRDRDSRHHRDRSRDRYREHDSYRSNRRDRSRERRRSRDRDGVKDDRRDRYRDDSRDRARKRRGDSADARRNGKRENSRERLHKPSVNGNEAPAASEEVKKAERLAKLSAWKEKQAAKERKQQEEAEAAGGARSLLAEIDKKARASPAVSSPRSPITTIETNGGASPAPYAGKFDPKAIARKAAAASTNSSKLGALPAEIAKMSATTAGSTKVALKANNPVATASGPPAAVSVAPLKARGNVSGFGLSGKAVETEKASTKLGIGFDDEEGGRKKLEKLLPAEDVTMDDTGMIDDDEDNEDDDEGMEEGTEEDMEARKQRLQEALQAGEDPAASVPSAVDTNGDIAMTEAPSDSNPDEAEEEADPLDTFMSKIVDAESVPKKSNRVKHTKQQKIHEAEAMFGDDDVDLEAVDDDLSTATIKKKKRKDIAKVDHSKIQYESFQKDFWTTPVSLADLTVEEIADLRLELGIKVKASNSQGIVPPPIQAWSQLGLSPLILDVIDRLGYEKPSPIQSQAIPVLMSGSDAICVAKTGSGKTLAFALPMLRHVKAQRPLNTLDGPIALIMTPTRELATQIHKECKEFVKKLGLTAMTAYGGTPIKDDIANLKRLAAACLIATPGRCLELAATGRLNFRRVTYLVLDECDRLFDLGFEPQIMRIISNLRPDRQSALFSATLPRQIQSLTAKALINPVEIVIGGKSVVAPEIEQKIIVIEEALKFNRLLGILGDLYSQESNTDIRTLCFVETQGSADSLMADLLRRGYSCLSLHGGHDQVDRNSTIQDFKAGVMPIMIATSVAARGLDVQKLQLVVNYDCPRHLEDFTKKSDIHRVGRTGRAGQRGVAMTMICPDQDRYSISVAKALRDSGTPIPSELQVLVDSFNEKVKSGKEKINSGSGFGGKGLERLDQERDAARTRERRSHKTGDEPDEDEHENKDQDDKGDDLITKAASSVQAASAPVPLAGVPKGIDLDGKIVVHKTEAPADGSKNPLDKVGRAVANIHDRLSKNKELRQGVPIDNKGPDAGAFHATLEINDFPQKARWAVTNRTNVAKILEATGTSITTKGSFYTAGAEPKEGEQAKLYILVEGDTEVVVTNAMRELMRLLKEGTIAAADSDARAPASGRYTVV